MRSNRPESREESGSIELQESELEPALDEVGSSSTAPVHSRPPPVPKTTPPAQGVPGRGFDFLVEDTFEDPDSLVPPGPAGARTIPAPLAPLGVHSSAPPPPPAPRSPLGFSRRPSAKPQKNDAHTFPQDPLMVIRGLEAELAGSPSPARTGRLHFEIARIYESPLRDDRRAAKHYEAALELVPTHLPAIRGARRVLIARRNYQRALELYDAEARITPGPRQKAALYLAKGRLLEDKLRDKAAARQVYATAIELDRKDASVLKALEQAQEAAEDWNGLIDIYERAANAVTEDERHRAALIAQRARLMEYRLDNPEAAVDLYESALRLDPTLGIALDALKRLHHRHRRWHDLIRILQFEAARVSDARYAAMTLVRISRLQARRLGNLAEGIVALERAAELTPGDPVVLKELAELYEASQEYGKAASVVERTWERLTSEGDRLALAHQLGELYEEKLSDVEKAIPWYEAAVEIDPTYRPSLQSLRRIYLQKQRWQDLVRILLGESEHASDPDRRASAIARVGELYELQLDSREHAIKQHARALALKPGYMPSFLALTRLLAQAKRWRELVELYEHAIAETTDRNLAITYLLKSGSLYEDQLEEPAQAAHAYRRILRLDGTHFGAVEALQRAAARAGRYAELVEALDIEATLTQDNARVLSLMHRAAEVTDLRLHDHDGALERFKRILAREPRHLATLQGLGDLYYRLGRWEDLLETYRQRLEQIAPGPDAVAVLERMAEIYEQRVGREDQALECYERILATEPGHVSARAAMVRQLEARGRWHELAVFLEKELGRLDQPADIIRIGMHLGETCEERVHEPERAILAYERVLSVAPEHPTARYALRRVLSERGNWKRVAEDLEREGASSNDARQACATLVQAAAIFEERLSDFRRAARCLEAALQHVPDHLGALLSLQRLYTQLEGWEPLARLYGTMAAVCKDPAARMAALREKARLLAGHELGSDIEERQTCLAMLELKPDDEAALQMAEELAIQAQDRDLIVAIHAGLASKAVDGVEKASHLVRQAEALEKEDPTAALALYKTALEADAESVGAARGLSRLAEQIDDPAAMVESARREAEIARDPQSAARLLTKSAILRADRLNDLEGAVADLQQALEICPEDIDAATRLKEFLSSPNDAERLSTLLARAAASSAHPDRSVALWREVATIQQERLDNVPSAIGSLNRALRVRPKNTETLTHLAKLHELSGQWAEAAHLFERVIGLRPDPEHVQAAHLCLAALWDERLNEPERAIASLEAALAYSPTNAEALTRLSAVEQRIGRFERAADAAVRLVKGAAGPEERATALTQLASVEQDRQQPEAALQALKEAVSLAGPASEAALELRAVSRTPEDWTHYLSALLLYLEGEGNGTERSAGAYSEIARVQFDHMADVQGSLTTLANGVRAHPDNLELRTELGLRLAQVGHLDQASKHLQEIIARNPTRAQSYRDLSRIFARKNADIQAALSLAPLVVLQEASAEEGTVVARACQRVAEAPAESLSPEVLESLWEDEPSETAAREMLQIISPVLGKVFPADLGAYGLSPRDRVNPKASPIAIYGVAQRLAEVTGVVEFDLYLHRLRLGVAVETGDRPSLLVPEAAADLPLAEQIFLLGRAFVMLSFGLHALEKLTSRELEILVASAARMVAPGYGEGLTSEDTFDDQKRRTVRALSRRQRKTLEKVATRYVAAGRLDFAGWQERVGRMANGVACLLANDLGSSVRVLQSLERDTHKLQGSELVQASSAIADLLRFWTSAQAFDLRRRIGVV